jgi:hypothetical protein
MKRTVIGMLLMGIMSVGTMMADDGHWNRREDARDVRHDHARIMQERAELRHDRRELRHDYRDLRHDRREFHRDYDRR